MSRPRLLTALAIVSTLRGIYRATDIGLTGVLGRLLPASLLVPVKGPTCSRGYAPTLPCGDQAITAEAPERLRMIQPKTYDGCAKTSSIPSSRTAVQRHRHSGGSVRVSDDPDSTLETLLQYSRRQPRLMWRAGHSRPGTCSGRLTHGTQASDPRWHPFVQRRRERGRNAKSPWPR
jgi:hypothetical protein